MLAGRSANASGKITWKCFSKAPSLKLRIEEGIQMLSHTKCKEEAELGGLRDRKSKDHTTVLLPMLRVDIVTEERRGGGKDRKQEG